MNEVPVDDLNARKLQIFLAAAQSFLHGSTDPKSAIRRAARTSDWKHSEERVAAADAKRARKMAKRATADQPDAAK